jgi:hypothetical protein
MGGKKWVLSALVTGLLRSAILPGLPGFANARRRSRTGSVPIDIPLGSAMKTVVVFPPAFRLSSETGLDASAREDRVLVRWRGEMGHRHVRIVKRPCVQPGAPDSSQFAI